MNLKLSKGEAELVTRILADYLGNLRMEIAETDSLRASRDRP